MSGRAPSADEFAPPPPASFAPPRVEFGALLSGVFLLLLALAATWPHLLAPANPLAIAPRHAFEPPGWAHPFGTDQSGRDVFTRVVHGARFSLTIGIGSIGLAMLVAVVLGLAGGLGGRLGAAGVGALLEVLFSFPTLVLALVLVAIVGTGTTSLVVATGIGSSPGYARLVLSQVIAVRDAGYVEAARALGHHPMRIVLRHVLPNAMRPLVVTVTMGVGHAVIWASALSFLGLGTPPPTPEWGTMLAMGRDFIINAPWLTFFPGLVIVGTMLATTVLGRFLQRRIEGRLR